MRVPLALASCVSLAAAGGDRLYHGEFGFMPTRKTWFGTFKYLDSYTNGVSNAEAGATGKVHMTVDDADGTQITVEVDGLNDKQYPAHLHKATCTGAGGPGGHYQNVAGGDVDNINEAWPAVTGATGKGSSSNTWKADMTVSRSVVIHAGTDVSGNPKMLCADLVAPTGTATVKVASGGWWWQWSKTEITLNTEGLEAGLKYPAHLHKEPCADGAGGHYMNDADGGVNAQNEAWPAVQPDGESDGVGKSSNDWAADMGEPRSVVIHDLDTPARGKKKMICADLNVAHGRWEGDFGLFDETAFNRLSGKFSACCGYDGANKDATGTAQLTVRDGKTTISVQVEGLKQVSAQSDGIYPAHLHLSSCDSPGGHYQDNGAVVDANNEAWPAVSPTGKGTGMGDSTNDWAVRLDQARSVVIHAGSDGNSNPKMLCADLVKPTGHVTASVQKWEIGRREFEKTAIVVHTEGVSKTSYGRYSGTFAACCDYAGGNVNAGGTVKMAITQPGTSNAQTKIEVKLTGVTHASGFPGGDYPAHLHLASCASPGGHYNNDGVAGVANANAVVDKINEAWPAVHGTTHEGTSTNNWAADMSVPRSVVVHVGVSDGSGPKMLCADLVEDGSYTFPAHLHTKKCADGAGGHYQDQSGPSGALGAVDAQNEAWPAVTGNFGYSKNDWMADMGDSARSVVIHAGADWAGNPKMVCADLQYKSSWGYESKYGAVGVYFAATRGAETQHGAQLGPIIASVAAVLCAAMGLVAYKVHNRGSPTVDEERAEPLTVKPDEVDV